ncbi:MAG: thiamine pyrophosphate-dependent enzyme [Verrucomicrobiota bacterium]
MADLSNSQKKQLLENMILSRESDRREGILIRQGKGWFHIGSSGHEALAALAMGMTAKDFLFPHYRDRALILQRGVKLLELAQGFFGKRESSSGGRQLPSHFSNRRHNIWSMPSPTGSNLLPACGTAWGMKLQKAPHAVVACVGDAGMRQGEFYEAYVIAHELKLPVVFIVEDNQFGISTCTKHSNPLRLGLFSQEYFQHVNARRVDEVYQSSTEALEKARSGQGPQLLWFELDRMSSHSSSDDHRIYRSSEDIEQMDQRDPVQLLAADLISSGEIDEGEWKEMQDHLVRQVEGDYWEAERSKDPRPEETYDQILGDREISMEKLPGAEEEKTRMIDAINKVFGQALERDPHYVFFGEDIEDPMGGVFKLTNGLSSRFPERVFNSPLAEATIMGMSCGLAAYGMRPVFELQFIDFVGPAWNQLVTNLSTLRWRTFGEWICPAVIYAPYGAYLPAGGPWHSQSNEGAFAHIPGLRIVVPSTPEDAAGLMHTALMLNDPTLVLLPKHLLRMKMDSPSSYESIPVGKARIRKEGQDVTLVTWGNCVDKVLQAIEGLPHNISVEVIDLRSIVPWDKECVKESVFRTGRLIVVQEDNRSCSMGQKIISEILEEQDIFEFLRMAPKLVSRGDVHIGFNPIFEETALPSKEEIIQAVMDVADGGRAVETAYIKNASKTVEAKSLLSKLPVKVPMVGEGLEEARVLKFFKQPGDAVKKDEPIYQLETDKAVVDVESPFEGKLLEWVAAEDSTVEIGSVIGMIQSDLADDLEEELIESEDEDSLEKANERASSQDLISTAEYDETSLSPKQQVLANRLVRAARVAVPATIFQEVDWRTVIEARKTLKENADTEEISTFALVAWSITQAAKKNPTFRSSLPQQSVLRVYKKVHLGVAVSLPGDDLVTAVVENADDYNLREFAQVLKKQVEKARKGVDQARENVSLIITSMSAFDIPHGIPVIVPPAVATILVNAPHQRLEASDNGEIAKREIVNLSLTIDHRVINGGGAAAFLNDVKANLETLEVRPDLL